MKTLLIIDVQNDFLPGGSLPVAHGNEILPIIQKLIPKFEHVIATQDWHPPKHISFASVHNKKPGEVIKIGDSDEVLWPDHCIQNTKGAELAKEIDQKKIHKIFYKGTDIKIDSYSAFFDNARKRSTGLDEYLKEKNINELYFCGLATDYCVFYSVLDARSLGYKTYVIEDACQAVNLKEGDEMKAFKKMKEDGAILLQSSDLLQS